MEARKQFNGVMKKTDLGCVSTGVTEADIQSEPARGFIIAYDHKVPHTGKSGMR